MNHTVAGSPVIRCLWCGKEYQAFKYKDDVATEHWFSEHSCGPEHAVVKFNITRLKSTNNAQPNFWGEV